MARAGCSNSSARAIRWSIRFAPSSSENSEWQCRCTNDIELRSLAPAQGAVKEDSSWYGVRNRLNVNGLVCSGARWWPRMAMLALVAGCSHERVLAAARDYQLRAVSGDGQTAPAGSLLPRALAVEVRDARTGSP